MGAMSVSDSEQEIISRGMGLDVALQYCLAELAAVYGSDAKTKLRTIRDKLVLKFEQSDIPQDRELEHAKIVRPAIDAIEASFEDFV
jgi:hypothetical protein